MARKKGNPALDPWYPWDFENPRPAGARDNERFKLFLAIKTWIWYFVGYVFVPACFFQLAFLNGWGPPEWENFQVPGLVWMSVLWIFGASWISKALPNSLLQGSLSVNISRRNRLATILTAIALCLICGAGIIEITGFLKASSGWVDLSRSVLFCPGLGLLFWALFYAFDFVRTLFKKSAEYHLDEWRPKDFGKSSKKSGEIEIAHWSDIHLTARDEDTSVSGDKGNNQNFKKALCASDARLKSVNILLTSGDVADAGRASEWHVFFHEVPLVLQRKMVLVPGNHDMNIVDRSDWFMVEGQGRLLRKKRLIRTMAALNRVQGKRSWIQTTDKKGQTQYILLEKYLDGFKEIFREFLEGLTALQEKKPGFWDYLRPPVGAWLFGKKGRLEILALDVDRAWAQIFPMAVSVPGTQAIFLVLNSNKEDTGIVDNALGQLTPTVLERLEEMQEKFCQRPIFYSLHHHVALPQFHLGFLGDVQVDMMALLNAGDFVERLLGRNRSVIFHGHRHIGYTGVLSEKIQIVSAPSVTLGNELEHKSQRVPGFYSFRAVLKGKTVITGRRFWGAE